MITTNPAEDLEGVTLAPGWTVVERIHQRPGDTGGNFSVNYWVVDESGRRGFCKVLNYWWLLTTSGLCSDPLSALSSATQIYQFERDLARECVGLSRVITALTDGSFQRDNYLLPLVNYIIFEVADGDIRRVLDDAEDLDVAVRLRTLHHLATGIRQLHGRNVAHQDVKPSNTLVFAPDLNGLRVTKLGDLGRATVQGKPMDHDDYEIAGDHAYAPPEGLYRAVPTDFGPRRLACDLYQLGSMVSFIFTAVSMNGYLKLELHPTHNWQHWHGTYEDVLPYVRDAFGRSVGRISTQIPEPIRDRVAALIRCLCEPDPMLRGHPTTVARVGSPYSLDRIVTELDLLSRRAAVHGLKTT